MAADKSSMRAPKGTYDLLPPESLRWRRIVGFALDETFLQAGYTPIETPAFEHTEVFERGVGESSEVVNKQMYTFEDSGGRSLTLRPEGTAPVVRALLEHGLGRAALPVKLAYAGSMFRQERPQKGRYRQFFQIGIEAIGSDNPAVDAEVIEIGVRFLERAGVAPKLLLNSVGHLDGACRLGYVEKLRAWLEEHLDGLAPVDRERVRTNPLRTFDSKESRTVETMTEAPLISEHLCDACRKHFDEVTGLLSELGVGFELEPRLVRGLDYYTRTAFEFVAEGLGSQNAVGGGGRYDGLAEALGGRAFPGIGFALGVDRILLASTTAKEWPTGAVDVYVVTLGEPAARAGLKLATDLRRRAVGADLDLMGRAMKGQMKEASRSGARWAAILGSDELAAGEVTLKDLDSGDQERVPVDAVVDLVVERLGRAEPC